MRVLVYRALHVARLVQSILMRALYAIRYVRSNCSIPLAVFYLASGRFAGCSIYVLHIYYLNSECAVTLGDYFVCPWIISMFGIEVPGLQA
jgi:hypothetical protein